MRKYLIGAAIVALLVILVVVALLRQHARPVQQKIYQSNYTATDIQFPYLANSHTVDYFSGSVFASYDLNTHTTTALSPQLSLPTVSAMRWSASGVLFEASNSTVEDELYPAATAFQLDPSQEYWWLYSFTTQQISYVHAANQSQLVSDAWWVTGSSSQYDYVAGNTVVSSGGKTLFSDSAGIAQLEYASPSAVYYETTSASPVLKEYNLTSGTTTVVVRGTIKDVAVAASGSYVVYVDHYNAKATGNTPGDLELLNVSTGKTSRIMGNYEGTTSLNSDSDLLISSKVGSAANELLRYDLGSGQLTALSSSGLDQNNSAASLWVIDPNNYIVDSAASLLTVFRDQPATQPLYPNYDYLIQGDIYQNGFEIHYRSDNGTDVYSIYITQSPYAQYQQAALQYIQSQKIDPNLLNIKWYSNDGVTPPTNVSTTVPSGYFAAGD